MWKKYLLESNLTAAALHVSWEPFGAGQLYTTRKMKGLGSWAWLEEAFSEVPHGPELSAAPYAQDARGKNRKVCLSRLST